MLLRAAPARPPSAAPAHPPSAAPPRLLAAPSPRLLAAALLASLAACSRAERPPAITSEPAAPAPLASARLDSPAPSAPGARAPSAPNAPNAPNAPDAPPAASAVAQANDPRFHKDLLLIARNYTKLNALDGTHWAPTDCAAPQKETYLSRATGAEHGQKLYTLWVKDRAAYPSERPPPSFQVDPPALPSVAAFAQVLVKEAWTAEETCAHGKAHRLAPVQRDGKTFLPCDKAPIFIMYRPPAGTPGTDEGWVYGTTSPDGQEVTSAGRVLSCMGCHLLAPHGRLFGLPDAP